MRRSPVPKSTATELLIRCRRRCALCFGLDNDQRVKRGQIAHIDRNPAHNEIEDLVWLCVDHHDSYDSRSSQTRGVMSAEVKQHKNKLEQLLQPPQPEKIRWGPNDDLPAGVSINGKDGLFVPWSLLKPEIESRLLNHMGRHVPPKSTVVVRDYFGRRDWIVRVIDPEGKEVGHLWFGSNPDRNWSYDGLVRVGKPITDYVAEVWQTFQRFSDGTYRRIDPSHSSAT